MICDEERTVVLFQYIHRTTKAAPNLKCCAVSIEDLHAIVLSIADEQPAAAVRNDRMGRHKFPRSVSDFAEASNMLANGAETMNSRVAISISDVNFAVHGNRGLCWMVEWRAPMGDMAFSERREPNAI